MLYLVVIALVLLGLYAARRLIFRGLFAVLKRRPEYQAQMDLLDRSYRAEESVVEEADWFGTTGLSEEDERELPKYLRREFGELLLEEGSLQASNLKYIGAFEEHDALVHYWVVPSSDGEPCYAYIEVTPTQTCTGWGNREPPNTPEAERDAVVQ